jgi:cytochrome c2
MKTKKYFIAVLLLASINFAMQANPPADEGKIIFISRCAACHNVNKQLTGPALAGVYERRSIDWIINFIHSSQTMVVKGDTAAVSLFNKFNKTAMPDHKDLSETDIKSIVEYIKMETKAAPVNKAPFEMPGKRRPTYKPVNLTRDYGFLLSYLGGVFMLMGVLYFAVSVNSYKNA